MKQSGLVKRINDVYQKGYEEGYEMGHRLKRQITLDTVVITLGQMGIEPEKIHEFAEKYIENENDYMNAVLEEGKSVTDGRGKHVIDISQTKYRIDEELRKYVLPEDFFDYDTRYRS